MRTSNYLPATGVNNDQRFIDGLHRARSLGVTGFRFSIEWSRIQPALSLEYDQCALDKYLDWGIIAEMLGMKVLWVLDHFTLPQWAADLGGWHSPIVIGMFGNYAKYVAERLPADPLIATLNEPETYAMMTSSPSLMIPKSDAWLDYPQGLSCLFQMRKQLARAHNQAAAAIKRVRPDAQVGITLNHTYFDGSDDPAARAIRRAGKWLMNDDIASKVASSCDWLGLQYYFHCRVNGFKLFDNDFERRSDLGWELHPWGLEPLLVDLSRFGKPIYVTEFGLADERDEHRAWYFKEGFRSIAKAIQRGVNCLGCFPFSDIDGIGGEWATGSWPCTGFATRDGELRSSAWDYAQIIADRGV